MKRSFFCSAAKILQQLVSFFTLCAWIEFYIEIFLVQENGEEIYRLTNEFWHTREGKAKIVAEDFAANIASLLTLSSHNGPWKIKIVLRI